MRRKTARIMRAKPARTPMTIPAIAPPEIELDDAVDESSLLSFVAVYGHVSQQRAFPYMPTCT